jgi:putative transposase
MPHTYVCNRIHVVFSTQGRRQLIRDPLKPKLWAYMGGIARKNGMKALAVGGTDDHAHLLLSLSAVMPIAKAVQLIKAGSSKWVREGGLRMFAWQENYSAFSVSASLTAKVVAYINSQEEHHRKQPFDAELRALLEKHGIVFEPDPEE